MGFDLSDRCIVVAGGSGGIGSAIVAACARSGARVSVCARSGDKLEAFRQAQAAEGHDVHVAPCDLGDPAAVSAYADAAVAALGGLDVVVNTVSAFGAGDDDDDEDWEKSFGVDLMSTVRLVRAFVPHLRDRGGLIVNFASTAGLRPAPRTPAYAATKAAILHYTRTQALALAPHKIRVNAVAPGSIDMPGGLWDKRKTSDPELYKATLESIPLGAMGRADDVAGAVLFLASEHGRFITGQTVVVDGGQSLA